MLVGIYPVRIRGVGTGIAVFGLFGFDFVIHSLFPIMLNAWGGGATFGIFAACNTFMLILLFKYLPETRGLTLEEIERKFRQ